MFCQARTVMWCRSAGVGRSWLGPELSTRFIDPVGNSIAKYIQLKCAYKPHDTGTTMSRSEAGQAVEPNAYKLWIHCNRCYAQFTDKQHTFFLLACHHVFCERCVKVSAGRTPSDAPVFECPTCRRSVRGRQLINSMPNHFKQLFHPEPFTVGNDFAVTFQRCNHRHFDKYKERKEMEMEKLCKDIEVAKSVCQKRFLEAQMLRVERKKLMQRSRYIKAEEINRKAEMHRMTQTIRNRSLTSQNSSSAQSSVRGRSRGRGGTTHSSLSRRRSRDSRESDRSSSAKRNQITSFIHPPNHSFDL
ncbi:RING finger protein vilya [Drosophila yakuba]|nr:RING finger protein vilya [Drosophila yakuba]